MQFRWFIFVILQVNLHRPRGWLYVWCTLQKLLDEGATCKMPPVEEDTCTTFGCVDLKQIRGSSSAGLVAQKEAKGGSL